MPREEVKFDGANPPLVADGKSAEETDNGSASSEGAAGAKGLGSGTAEEKGTGTVPVAPPPLTPPLTPPGEGKGKGKGKGKGEGDDDGEGDDEGEGDDAGDGLLSNPLLLNPPPGEGDGEGEGESDGEGESEGESEGEGEGEGESEGESEGEGWVEEIPVVELLDDFYVVVEGDTTAELMKGVNAYLQREDGLRYYVYHGVQLHEGKYYQAVVQLPFDFGKRVWEFMNAKAFRVETDGEKVEALASDAMPYVLENLNFRASERKRKVVIKIPNDVKQGELVTYEFNGISRQFIADKDYTKGAEVTIDTEPAGVLKIALQLPNPEADQFVLYKHTDGQVYQQTLRTVAQDAEGKLTVLFQGRPKRKKGETKHTFSMTVPAGVDGSVTGYWVTADDLSNVLKVSLAVPNTVKGEQTVEIEEPNVLARVRIPTAVASQIVVYKGLGNDNKAYHPKLITKDGQEVTFFAPRAARAEPAPLKIVPSGSPVAETASAVRSGEPLDATPDEEALDTTVTARLTAPRDLTLGSKVVIYLFDQTTGEYREYFFTAEKDYEKGSEFKVQFVQPEAPAE